MALNITLDASLLPIHFVTILFKSCKTLASFVALFQYFVTSQAVNSFQSATAAEDSIFQCFPFHVSSYAIASNKTFDILTFQKISQWEHFGVWKSLE